MGKSGIANRFGISLKVSDWFIALTISGENYFKVKVIIAKTSDYCMLADPKGLLFLQV
uniref:Uncharacterized protein n=1 Tax=Lepeophtheirus salmonis TaxID=72036 RepID=A0A0K2TWU9_LEPSM